MYNSGIQEGNRIWYKGEFEPISAEFQLSVAFAGWKKNIMSVERVCSVSGDLVGFLDNF